MANNNFNVSDFFKGEYYAPIQMGKHEVKLGKIKPVIETKEDGSDASYLLVPMTFENGRVIEQRFYGIGAKIFCDQTRQQTGDVTDYKKLDDYLKALKDATLNVWISKRTYLKDSAIKTTLQYDFVEPEEVLTEATDAEEEVF